MNWPLIIASTVGSPIVIYLMMLAAKEVRNFWREGELNRQIADQQDALMRNWDTEKCRRNGTC